MLAFASDADAAYEAEFRWDASTLEPMVAQPFLPSNVAPAGAVKDVKVDQVIIGSCTNGRIQRSSRRRPDHEGKEGRTGR